MYRKTPAGQISFADFYLPFGGTLDGNNRWVKLAALIPWEQFENEYAEKFSQDEIGAPAIKFRVALGSQIIKEKLEITDEETIEQIKENPYLQYFIGMEGFRTEAPFEESMMTHFRKRLGLELIKRINEMIIEERDKKKDQKRGCEEAREVEGNKGELLIDATCVPQDIRYPNDISLLNEAREKSEKIIDKLHEGKKGKEKKPRTYRRKARKNYLGIAKQRKKTRKTIRRGIRQQLGYLKRNLKTIAKQVENGAELNKLSKKEYKDLLVINELARQQEEMYKNKTHHAGNRIVSISQPHVRPIVRGKAGSETEFGAKLTISVVDGMTRIEKLSWDNYNEGTLLVDQVEAYRERYGYYPEAVLVDKIYHNQNNRRYCKEHGIRMSGPKLGRPSNDKKKAAKEKQQEKLDANARQPVEGKFGNGKRRYGLDRIYCKLPGTSETEIGIIVLILNLETELRDGIPVSLFFIFIENKAIIKSENRILCPHMTKARRKRQIPVAATIAS
jgi:hypothetical protein